MFSGSLRANLDPFSRFSDADIWSAVERAHLGDYVHATGSGLDYDVGEAGQNLRFSCQNNNRLINCNLDLKSPQHGLGINMGKNLTYS